MKTNAIIREIRKHDPNAFKALNMHFGFDFEKKFNVLKVDAPATVNKIWKAIKEKGYQENTNEELTRVAVMVLGGNKWGAPCQDFRTVEIFGTGNADFNIIPPSGLKYTPEINTKVDFWYAKGDFNECRKTGKIYVVCQAKADLANVYKKKTADYSGTFDRFPKNAGKTISGRTHTTWSRYVSASDLVFDKSGYEVTHKQNELSRKADALRKERAKARFDATDNTAIINALKARIDGMKSEIIDALKVAETRDQLGAVAEMLNRWHGLGDVFGDFASLKKGEKEKTFSSVGAFNDSFARINSRLDQLKTELDEYHKERGCA